jgi:N-acetylmuramoyl-L-alanine amidase
MRVFKYAGILFCGALFFLAGCATSPDEPVPTEWTATNAAPKTVLVPTNTQYPLPTNVISQKTNVVPVIHSNPPPVSATNVFKSAPVVTWTSLSRWAADHKTEKPRLIYNSPVSTYAVVAGKNLMTFTLGSHEATWNGIGINLGFEPEMIDGEIFVHALDLQKNLYPLLYAPPLEFSKTNRVIVLDPGHGGMNGGTVSVLDKRPEKEFTLDLARRLLPLLVSNGWTVFLTRTNDYDVSLSNRVAIAEFHHADCFISLHFNSAAPEKKQNGLETYCLTPTGMPSTLTRGFADPWSENLPNNNFDAQNIQFAVRLHKAVLNASGEEDRGVRRARFLGVLRGQKRPAILIEGGYLSNPVEAAEIENPDFRQKLAEAIAKALK